MQTQGQPLKIDLPSLTTTIQTSSHQEGGRGLSAWKG